MRYKCMLFLVLLALIVTPIPPLRTNVSASPDVKTITIDKDVYINEAVPDTNYGTYSRLYIGRTAPSRLRTLIYFDVSDIAPGSTITSAKLVLTFKSHDVGFTSTIVRVHRVVKFWAENIATWNVRSKTVWPFVITWPWDNPGGDFDPTTEASKTVSAADVGNEISWEIKNLVQKFVDKVYANYGIILEADTSPKWLWFSSSEGTDPPYLEVQYIPAKIELTPTPDSQTVVQGGSVSYQIVVGGTYKGNANVLTDWIAPAPAGATITTDVASGVPPFVLTVTVQTSATTPPGDYKLRVELQGTEGSPAPSEAVILDLHVEPPVTPDFNVIVTPGSQSVPQGGTAEFIVELTATGGFSDPVALSISGLPSGSTFSFSPNNQVPDFTSVLSISVPETAPLGAYSIVVTGSGGGKTHDYSVVLEVTEATGFTVEVEPTSKTAQQGQAVDFTVHITGMGGFSDPVTLAIAGLPPGAAISATANSLPPDYDSTITIQLAPDTPVKTYTMYIIGTGGGLSVKSNAFTLTVTSVGPSPSPTPSPSPSPTPSPTPSPAEFDFEITVTPKTLTIPTSGSGSIVIQLELTSGTGQQVTLSATGLPNDATYSFNPVTLTPTGSSTLYITAGNTPGAYTVLIKASGGGIEKSATLQLTIQAQRRCVIATVTYGSELSPEVQFLREFRDKFVLRTFAGQQFMRAFNTFYYSWSTSVANLIEHSTSLRDIFKISLYPLIGTLKLAISVSSPLNSVHPEAAVTIAGIVSSLLLGLIYLTPLLVPIITLYERHKSSFSNKLVKWLVIALICSLVILTLGEILLLQTLVLAGSSALVLSCLPLLAIPVSKEIGKRLS